MATHNNKITEMHTNIHVEHSPERLTRHYIKLYSPKGRTRNVQYKYKKVKKNSHARIHTHTHTHTHTQTYKHAASIKA